MFELSKDVGQKMTEVLHKYVEEKKRIENSKKVSLASQKEEISDSSSDS